MVNLILLSLSLTAPNPKIDAENSKYVPGKGLEIKSKDERFALATRLRAQMLYSNIVEGRSSKHGLQIRRARLQFKGHFWNKHNKFKTEFAFSPKDMGYDGDTTHRTPILDWYFDFDYLKSLTIRIGQYKVPFSRQRVISSGNLQFVDRTIANKEFNLDRDIGIDLRSKDFLGFGFLRYYTGVYLGEGRDQFEFSNYEMMYIGRVEILPVGLFDDYSEADLNKTDSPKISLGAGYSFVNGATKDKGIIGKSFEEEKGKSDFHNVTTDFVFKYKGVAWASDFYYRKGEIVGDQLPRQGFGWSSQLGYVVSKKVPLEISGRYAQVRKDKNSVLDNLDEPGGAASYYFFGHPMKLQLDCAHRFNGLQSVSDIVRLQLQASF